jgi:DNA-binding FrmR family transcriptional regulator
MHTTREKKKLINRIRRIRGQLEAVEAALNDEKGCAEVLHTVAAARGALNGRVPGRLLGRDHFTMNETIWLQSDIPDALNVWKRKE